MRDKLSYFAAMLDGEGYLNLGVNKSGSLVVRIGITNTNSKLMDWLSQNFGGYVTNGKDRVHTNRKAFRMWAQSGAKAVELVREVTPLLILKTEQAKLFLEAWEQRQPTPNYVGPRGPTEQVLALRREYVAKMHVLNKKGL